MRVLFTSLICVTVLVLALFGVREWALMTPSQRFEHGFLDAHPVPHQVVRVENLEQAQSLRSLAPQTVLWLDLRFSVDGKFLVLNSEKAAPALTLEALGIEKWKGAQLPRYTENELRVIFPEAPRLQDFLEALPKDQRFVLNVIDNAAGVHTELVEILKTANPDQRFLLQSDTDIILKSLKDQKPLWLYGSSRADLMKVLTFESMGLQAASPFRGDVFISPFQISGRDAFNDGVIQEIHRRKKDVFIGPMNSIEEIEIAKTLKVQGYIFSSLELFKQTLSK